MKIRTLKFIIKEGFINLYRNKLMTLASVSIVTASLIIFGIFYLTAINLENNLKVLGDQPEMEVFCSPDLDDLEITNIEKQLKNISSIKKFIKVSKSEAFKDYEKMLDNNSKLLEGFDESIAPVSFVVDLDETAEDVDKVSLKLKAIEGVEDVRYSKKTVELIKRIMEWMRVIIVFQTLLLVGISVFIISNTIKLTVFARRRDIGIMKYVGATDWFIRLPFIVEGIMIGIIGAVVSFLISSYGYSFLEAKFNSDLLGISVDFIRLISLNEIGGNLFTYFAAIGTAVGAFGSMISIRKYLHV